MSTVNFNSPVYTDCENFSGILTAVMCYFNSPMTTYEKLALVLAFLQLLVALLALLK